MVGGCSYISATTLCQREMEEDEEELLLTHRFSLDEIFDRLLVMRQQETVYSRNSCCHNSSSCNNKVDSRTKMMTMTNNHDSVTRLDIIACWRSTMCQWFYNVVDICGLSRESAYIAMSYVDRYIGSIVRTQGNEEEVMTLEGMEKMQNYQLICMTALYMAIKIHEKCSIRLSDIVKLSCGNHSEHDIMTMELSMLMTLQWKLNEPTPYDFLACFVSLFISSSQKTKTIKQTTTTRTSTLIDPMDNIKAIMANARYQIELSVMQMQMQSTSTGDRVKCFQLPSQIALAAFTSCLSYHEQKSFLLSMDYGVPGFIESTTTISSSAATTAKTLYSNKNLQ